MANVFYSYKFNNLCVFFTLVIFSVTTIPQVHASYTYELKVPPNEIAFGLRIKNYIDKINKYVKNSNSKKLLDTMIELKRDVEGHTGKKISIDKEFDKVEKEIQKQIGSLGKEDLKKVKKVIKDKVKRSRHKEAYMENCIAYDIEYNDKIEFLNFIANENLEEKIEGELPLRVTIGVTLSLCGLFLVCVPNPICSSSGKYMLSAGVGMVVDEFINRADGKNKYSCTLIHH